MVWLYGFMDDTIHKTFVINKSDGHTIIVGFGSMISTNVGNFIQDGNLT